MIIEERQINRYYKDIVDETCVFYIYPILSRIPPLLSEANVVDEC